MTDEELALHYIKKLEQQQKYTEEQLVKWYDLHNTAYKNVDQHLRDIDRAREVYISATNVFHKNIEDAQKVVERILTKAKDSIKQVIPLKP